MIVYVIANIFTSAIATLFDTKDNNKKKIPTHAHTLICRSVRITVVTDFHRGKV